MDNLTGSYMNSPAKGLITDLDPALVSKEFWTHARNSTINSHQGNLQFLQNEPSNQLCVNIPYPCIGFVKLIGGRYAMFLTDNFNSEIGIFNTNDCSYTKVVNSQCLAFNTSYLIDASSKENFDCSETLYWTDGLNPRRYLNLSNVPYTFTLGDDVCETKTFTHILDCDEILMNPKLTVPTIELGLGSGGELRNGAYQIGMAYTINNQRLSDYYAITTPQDIWSHANLGQSIDITITNLDRNFDQFLLFVIYTQNQVTTAKIMGYFSTAQSSFELVNINRPEYITVPIEEIVTRRPKYSTADHVVNNDQFLLWAGVSTTPELNYQQQAMNIVPKWALYQVPVDYYVNGGNKAGYCRGERYAFAIQWLYNTGEYSSAFHIPGRKATGNETAPATGNDVYEVLTAVNGVVTPVRSFEVYDSSSVTDIYDNTDNSNQFLLKSGNMSYWESVDTYPDNKIMFGDDSCKPIRHPQFPRECVAPRYEKGGANIYILGALFENIEHPKDVNGKYINSVVGYRIVRSTREGNKSIIAKGMFSNVRSYKETLNQAGNNQKVLYSNYPYNDLRSDNFISSQQSRYDGGEIGFTGLNTVENDQFNFYSPMTSFSNVGLGDQVIFESEEIGAAQGYFEYVWNHPQAKILSNSVFWLAIFVGAIDGVLSVFGKRCTTSLKEGVVSITDVTTESEVILESAGETFVNKCESLTNGLPFGELFLLPAIEAAAKSALKILQAVIDVGMAAKFAFGTASQLIADILSFLPYNKYAMQYDSHAFFTSNKCVKVDNIRRKINYYQYLYDGLNTVNNIPFNNFKRENSVYIQLSDDVIQPSTKDNTRQTLTDANNCNNINKSFNSTASMYYGYVSQKVQDQYGQIDAIIYQDTNFLDTTLINTGAVGSDDKFYTSGVVFGGDMFVNRFTVQKKHQFFRQNIANANFPDGTEYDYTLYRNVGFPRFWLNSEKYDISELIVTGSRPGRLPTNKYNLDCVNSPSGTSLSMSNVTGYFYLYNSGVMDFFVESEYNLDDRDFTGQFQNFYSRSQTNLSEIWRSDRIDTPEQFVYDRSLSKQLTENSILQQRIDYNPTTDLTCFSYYKNRVIYSLPASLDLKSDNWLVYLTNNFYDFPLSDFGAITGLHAIDNQQIMFTFDKSAPYITIGRDELQTGSGVKITIGDAGLFAREPRPLAYTDYWYGNSQSRWAFVNTQFGSFYPSQRQGRIFKWGGQLDEITRQGMHWWFKEYLPSQLLIDFPNLFQGDNPVVGVGLVSGWDNTDERYYLSKRDYRMKDEFKGFVVNNTAKKRLELTDGKGDFLEVVKIGDPFYFDDASWTISYSPKDQAFISWHDWQPDWILQGETHFYTIKNNAIWLHNSRCDSYCNFYFEDFPWEIEYLVNNGPNVEILRSIEYTLESGIYYDDCRYYHQILDDNFDNLVVHNLEQSSGSLNLMLQPRKQMSRLLDWPQLTAIGDGVSWQVAYNKVEQKTRINQFWDQAKDRGEYAPKNNYPLWTISPKGYDKTVTPQAINLNKNQFEHKKFRNYWHKIFLQKLKSGNHKMIFKFANSPTTQSPR